MPGDTYPKFRAVAVQAAPVFLDRDATIDKLETLVTRAREATMPTWWCSANLLYPLSPFGISSTPR